MKKIIFVLFSIVSSLLFSQKNDVNWFFGDSALVTFTDTGIAAAKVSGYAYEASISYSDDAGGLLFYCDGSKIYNASKTIMSNSYLDIDQYISGTGSSICQGSIVVPIPQATDKFYVINKVEEGIKYSILDMTLNSGLGNIVVGQKDIWVYDAGAVSKYVSEKMTAIKHGNGTDWWVIFHERKASFSGETTNTFYKILVTTDGILGPYTQDVGKEIEDIYVGQMVFSPDGSKLAYTGNTSLEIFNFDRCTGELFELEKVDTIQAGFYPYGCAFSPDGNKVYVSNISNFGNCKIFQYCLDCTEDFSSTKKLIYNNKTDDFGIGQMLLGPDNKIYFPICYYSLPSSVYTEMNMNLSVINFPNEEGLSCDVDTASIWLGGARSITGLPNMPNYNLGALSGSPCDTLTSIQDVNDKNYQIKVYPNPCIDVLYFTVSPHNHLTQEITIFNLQGEVIKKTDRAETEKIDVHDLPGGLYFLRLNFETNNSVTQMFVKM